MTKLIYNRLYSLTCDLATNHPLTKTHLLDRFLITACLTADWIKWYTVCDSRLKAARWINTAVGCCSLWSSSTTGVPSQNFRMAACLCGRIAFSCLTRSGSGCKEMLASKVPWYAKERDWPTNFRTELRERRGLSIADGCFHWEGSRDNFSSIELCS